jgi:hypothetical protein
VSVALGSNSIFGTTGAGINGIDLDYLTITVLPGLQLSSIVLLPGTVNGGLFSFIGVQAGNQVTVSPSALDATGLLGWWHYNTATDINTDILGEMGIPAMGSTGFTPPLGPGDYSFWIQERGPGVYPYGFDFVLESSVSAPEPGTSPALLGGLLVLASAWRRRGRR